MNVDEFRPHFDARLLPFLEKILDKKRTMMLEFGSGHSTVWFAKRVMMLVTVESNYSWMNKVVEWVKSEKLYDVRFLWYRDKLPDMRFDVALIDDDLPDDWYERELYPHTRMTSAMRVLKVIHPKGIIILDDSHWSHAGKVVGTWLEEQGWVKIKEEGKEGHKTACFARSEFEKDWKEKIESWENVEDNNGRT